MRKRVGLLSMLLSISLLIVSPSRGADAVPGVTDTEIKIGNHSPQSGTFAGYGVMARTIKAYFDKVNSEGGIHGRKIKFIIGDSQWSGQVALQVTKKQVEDDNIFAFVGAGPGHIAVYRYLRQMNVPDLWDADPVQAYSNPVAHSEFAWLPPVEMDGEFWANFILKKFPGKTLGVLYANNEYGQPALKAFTKAINGKNKIVSEEANPKGDTAAKAQILNLKKAGAEVVFVLTAIPLTPAAIKFAHEQNYNPKWVLGPWNSYKTIFNLAGKEAIEGTFSYYTVLTDSEDSNPNVQKHIEFMKKWAPNETPTAGTLTGQGIAEITVEALRRAGKDLTREGLIKASESFKDWKCSVCRANITTSPENHLANKPSSPMVAHDGKWEQIKE